MKGTVIKRGKSWSVVLDVGRDATGKRLRRWHSGFTTKKAAEQARIALLSELAAGTYIEPSRVTVERFLRDDWLPSIRVRPTTMAAYRRSIDAHIVPALGQVELAKLSAPMLNRFYNDLLADGRRVGREGGLAPKSVRNIHAVLRQALGDAVRWGAVARNVADAANPPRPATPEMKVWTPDQLAAFLASVSGDRLAALWRLAASTGMRRGELVGLRWCDVDLDAATVTVVQAVTVVDSKPIVTEPKTKAGRRTISLDPVTVRDLREHRRRQVAERLEWGPAWHDAGLVFTVEDGRALHPERVSRWFGQATRLAGLPPIRLHDLRHSYVTMLLRQGVPLRVVSQRIGHASPLITMAVYAHVTDGDDEAAALAGAAALGG